MADCWLCGEKVPNCDKARCPYTYVSDYSLRDDSVWPDGETQQDKFQATYKEVERKRRVAIIHKDVMMRGLPYFIEEQGGLNVRVVGFKADATAFVLACKVIADVYAEVSDT